MLALKCLHDCLLSLDTKSSSLPRHEKCTSSHCTSGPLRNLADHLSLYIQALDLILLKRKNFKDRISHLSALYSLYIQSYVRRGLFVIERNLHSFHETEDETLHSSDYFKIPMLLTDTAWKTDTDPLAAGVQFGDSILGHEVNIAVGVFQVAKWEQFGIKSSSNFLSWQMSTSHQCPLYVPQFRPTPRQTTPTVSRHRQTGERNIQGQSYTRTEVPSFSHSMSGDFETAYMPQQPRISFSLSSQSRGLVRSPSVPTLCSVSTEQTHTSHLPPIATTPTYGPMYNPAFAIAQPDLTDGMCFPGDINLSRDEPLRKLPIMPKQQGLDMSGFVVPGQLPDYGQI